MADPRCFALLTATTISACAADIRLVAEGLPGAMLSVRGTAEDDVWISGAAAGSGPGLLRWDGASWTSFDLTSVGEYDAWWVMPTAEEVLLVGSGGLLASLDRASAEVTIDADPDPSITLFGVWGANADDVWAVGGVVGGDAPPAIWRREDGTWRDRSDELGPAEPGRVYFKVHGTTPDDVWVVGDGGATLHWDGTALSPVPTDRDTAPLLTVDAGGGEPIAVGGAGNALILHWDGTSWLDRSPEFQPGVNGVCRGGDRLVAVGVRDSVHAFLGEDWETPDELRTDTARDYHACWLSEEGTLWAVGGQIATFPLTDGLIARHGRGRVPSP
jgi:hypothetical protein